jgi:hypothetical protein
MHLAGEVARPESAELDGGTTSPYSKWARENHQESDSLTTDLKVIRGPKSP